MHFSQTNALQDQHQLAVRNDDVFLIMKEDWQFKGALFKPLMEDGKAISLPDEQLNLRTFII
jgi:hypothetical protein